LEIDWLQWLNLAVRWWHVFVGILWIGSTYYFSWLDGRFRDPEENPNGQVWMVHSGGFYLVEKRKVPELASRTLHWFRFEALFTWISGFLLLLLVYYLGGLLIDPGETTMSFGASAALALGMLLGGWIAYDLFWISPLSKNGWVSAAICYAASVAFAYGYSRFLSGRAAYIHVGALFGTLMAANVWMRILPAQRELVASAKAGKEPDAKLAERAKQRSKHNTFMVVPVVAIMISNHFPTITYGADGSWIVLAVLIALGWVAAKLIYRH
jgi:uncharacterized membrane protein